LRIGGSGAPWGRIGGNLLGASWDAVFSPTLFWEGPVSGMMQPGVRHRSRFYVLRSLMIHFPICSPYCIFCVVEFGLQIVLVGSSGPPGKVFDDCRRRVSSSACFHNRLFPWVAFGFIISRTMCRLFGWCEGFCIIDWAALVLLGTAAV